MLRDAPGRSLRFPLFIVLSALFLTGGCYRLRGSSGGGETRFGGPRVVDATDVAVPAGYRVEVVATGLTFPSGIAFDDAGRPHVIEAGYSYGEVVTVPRLLRLLPGAPPQVVAEGTNPPWNGVAYHRGAFYVAGGHFEGGRVLRITPDGAVSVLVDSLPSFGDHHTNGPAIGPDGHVYFGQGTLTNSGVVGPDNLEYGWLDRHPDRHDLPCRDVTLAGRRFTSDNPLTPDRDDRATTGAFAPFGTMNEPGQVVAGQLPCSGAVMRVPAEGGPLELVAWGFRNPFGLAFAPDGRLYVTDNGYDDRGSRPLWGTGDHLWAIEPGTWYGWPDYSGGLPLNSGKFEPPMDPEVDFLLARHPNPVPAPAAVLGVHSSSNGLDFSRSAAFGFEGDAFVAQFGDLAPSVGKVLAPVGFQVVRVDVGRGAVHRFATNRGRKTGPASQIGGRGLERPIAVRFAPDGSLYIVDFGVMTVTDRGPAPHPGTGVVWRVHRENQP